MTTALIAVLFLLAVVLLHVTVLPTVLPTTFRPDALLAATMTWGALAGYRQAVAVGVVGGFLVDLWGDAPIGVTGLLVGAVAFLTAVGEIPLVPANALFPLLAAFVGELLVQGLRIILFQALGRPVEIVEPMPALILLTAVSTALLALGFYPFARWLDRRRRGPRLEW
ncbi:MAG: rod shape-determining protein MreD [Chloroflexota bacterium]|nr:rod shape-determining protein MreD [Dehalococcoidia bacterium]MDW8252693.1 rod shape-determining protein MreD [Chloroflexota bacterium]